jgi:hypothetical protein
VLNFPGHKETQIKTALRFHLTPVKMAVSKNINGYKCWQKDVVKQAPLFTAGGMQISTTTWKAAWRLLKNRTTKQFNGTTPGHIPVGM